MANLITLSRLILLWIVIMVAYMAPPIWQLANVLLLIVVFVTDGLDGYVARKRSETSLFGALFDIAADRIVELTLWIVLADLDMIPIWVPLVYITRGVMVDAIRASDAESTRSEPFAMMQSPLGRWLVAGRFMRAFYAVLKAVAFCWLLLIMPLPELLPGIWAEWGWLLSGAGLFMVYLSVLICLARGIPVMVEFLSRQHRSATDV